MEIAAVHMESVLGDVDKNIQNAEIKISEAKDKGAELILFPEFFTTGFAFSNKLYDSVLKYDDPQDKLNEYAKEYNIIIGGSYLKLRNNNVYNTFTLTFPDGDKEDVREIMGATQIIDRSGKVASRKLYNEKSDIIIEDIKFDIKNRPKNTIYTNEYWVPKMPDIYLYGWKKIL